MSFLQETILSCNFFFFYFFVSPKPAGVFICSILNLIAKTDEIQEKWINKNENFRMTSAPTV